MASGPGRASWATGCCCTCSRGRAASLSARDRARRSRGLSGVPARARARAKLVLVGARAAQLRLVRDPAGGALRRAAGRSGAAVAVGGIGGLLGAAVPLVLGAIAARSVSARRCGRSCSRRLRCSCSCRGANPRRHVVGVAVDCFRVGIGDSSSSSLRSSSRGCSISCSVMKVVLPDQTELELPDGATGLDAARAIGPKLAEQAVLIRANGDVQDLRAAARGRPADPDPDDARHGRSRRALRPPPLVGASARRGGAAPYPGVKVAIGPPIENGFYYDFDFPEPIHEDDLERIEAEIAQELKEGREWTREEISRDEAKARFEAEGEPYKVRARRHRRGRHLALHAGRLHRPLPRPAPPELEADQGAQAHRPRRRVLARRLDAAAAHADLRHGVLLAGGSRRASRAARGGAQARPPRARAAARSLPSLRALARLAVLASEGDGDLERARGPAPPREPAARLRRGEDAAPLRHRRPTSPRATTTTTARTCSSSPRRRTSQQFALKPMNCPGHMLLFGSQLRSYRELPLRYAESSTLHRDELAGTLHGLLRVRHVTQDDAHIFCTPEQIEDGDLRLPRLRVVSLRPVRPRRALRALDAAGEEGRHRRGVGLHRGRARGRRSSAARSTYAAERGRRRLLRPEDRPAHDRRARPLVADGDDPARRDHAAAVRAHLHGRRTTASTRRTSSTARCSARSSASSASSSSTTAARSRSGSRPCRCGCCRSARRISRPRTAIVERLRAAGYRVDVGRADRDDRQADPRRRAREDPVHDRLRRPRERARASPSASAAASRSRNRSRISSRSLLRLPPEKQGRTRSSPPGREAPCGVQPSRRF